MKDEQDIDITLPRLVMPHTRCTTCGLELDTAVPVCPNDGTTLFTPPDVGTVFESKYEFIQRLAAGGMGVVFKAVQKGLDRPVAVKMLHASHMNPLVIRRFQQEAQALARLSHPNLVSVYELGVSDFQQPYMVMEYVDGKPFSALINRKSEIPIAKLLSIFIQICDGLAYIHSKNILHRDLKPSNVMLSDPESGDPKAKLVDFGIAKVIDREDQGSLTETGDVFGSPLYMSPEQAKGATVDKRTDIYSFGCVMYEALTGAPPFTGSSAVEIVLKQVSERQETLQRAAPLRRFPNGLQRIVDKALEKDVKDRYQSAEELKEDLLELRDKRWYHVRVKLPRAAKGKLARWVALTAAFAILSSAIITWQIVSQKRLQNNVVGLQSGGAMSGAKMDTKADGMVEQGERGSLREGHIDPDASVEGARSTDYDLSNEMVPADEWKLLADPRFRVISSFEADSSNITDEYLNRYVSCLPLTKLLLSETALTSKSIDKIASNFPHLQILKLNNVPLTSADVQSISKLKSLNYISLSGCGLDDACVKSLAKLPALSSVRLDDNANITDRGVGYLLNKPLASLGLSGTAVTDRAVAELSASPKLRASLRELWLNNGHLTDASLDDLRKMSDLRVLDIGNNNIASIDQKQLIDYLKGSKLRALSIYHLQIDDAILPALESMPELKELNLRDTLVTDKGLSTFKPAHLRKLNLQRCEKISRDGVNLFKKNNPDCKDIEKDEPISL